MISFVKRVFAVAAFAAAAVSASSQVTITLSGNAYGNGYNPNETYTFSFTLNPEWLNAADSWGGSLNWYESRTNTGVSIFSAISGTGFAGTYNWAPSSDNLGMMFVNSREGLYAQSFGMYIGSNYLEYLTDENGDEYYVEHVGAHGITTLTGVPVMIELEVFIPSLTRLDESYQHLTPSEYFAANAGTYALAGWGSGGITTYDVNYNNPMWADITHVTISVATAIPEPSTYTAIFGVGAMGLILWRRRQTVTKAV